MSLVEFATWAAFYRRHPFDDLHRYHRPAACVAHAVAGGDITARLDWLHPPAQPENLDDADMQTLRAFGIRPGGA